jgi:hypothetical protein
MELQTWQLSVALPAIWLWMWAARIARRDLPVLILLQQRIGVHTHGFVYRLANWGGLLRLGAVVVAAALAFPTSLVLVATVMLVLGAGLLTYMYVRTTSLLHPRIVSAVLARLEHPDGGPDEPIPA